MATDDREKMMIPIGEWLREFFASKDFDRGVECVIVRDHSEEYDHSYDPDRVTCGCWCRGSECLCRCAGCVNLLELRAEWKAARTQIGEDRAATEVSIGRCLVTMFGDLQNIVTVIADDINDPEGCDFCCDFCCDRFAEDHRHAERSDDGCACYGCSNLREMRDEYEVARARIAEIEERE